MRKPFVRPISPAKETAGRFLQHPTPHVPQLFVEQQPPESSAVHSLYRGSSTSEDGLVETLPAHASYRCSAEVASHQRLNCRCSSDLRMNSVRSRVEENEEHMTF